MTISTAKLFQSSSNWTKSVWRKRRKSSGICRCWIPLRKLNHSKLSIEFHSRWTRRRKTRNEIIVERCCGRWITLTHSLMHRSIMRSCTRWLAVRFGRVVDLWKFLASGGFQPWTRFDLFSVALRHRLQLRWQEQLAWFMRRISARVKPSAKSHQLKSQLVLTVLDPNGLWRNRTRNLQTSPAIANQTNAVFIPTRSLEKTFEMEKPLCTPTRSRQQPFESLASRVDLESLRFLALNNTSRRIEWQKLLHMTSDEDSPR